MKKTIKLIFMILFTIFIFENCGAVSCVYPPMDIYIQKSIGEAELEKAKFTKRIAIEEATAKLESAKLLNEAEILRAKGTAEANKILGNSLKNNEAYLRYLWIESVKETKSDKIYIATEAGMPILEARGKK
jgi:hypothetical protein